MIHHDIRQLLAQYPGRQVECVYSAAMNSPKTTVLVGRIDAAHQDSDSITVESQSRRGALVEEHFKCPHQA